MERVSVNWDVVVIGGGPAGSAVATLLAKRGYRALIVEKCAFPRFHTGESLLPGTWPIFWKLGIGDRLEQSGHQKKIGARFNLYGEREYVFGLAQQVLEYLPENRGKFHAFNVLRSTFDKMLLDNARDNGVTVLQPYTVDQVEFSDGRATGALLMSDLGEPLRVSARVVVDASGRDCVLSRRLGIRNPNPKLNKISYYAHFQGASHPRAEYLPIWLLAFDGGWVWYIPMMDDLVSVGAVVDPSYAKTREHRDLDAFFRDTCSRVPYVSDWLAGSRRVTDIHAVSALSYLTDRFVGDGWALIGDAIGFVDPIFSAGIHIALTTADVASGVIGDALDAGDTSEAMLRPYEDAVREQLNLIVPMIYRWYTIMGDRASAATFFDQAQRFSWLRRKVNASLVGAWDAVLHDPTFQFSGAPEVIARAQLAASTS